MEYDFPFEKIPESFEPKLLNEVGSRDIWPALAESITWGYGSAGTYGFRRPRVEDRWHYQAKHSTFLNAEFCRKYWVPFLTDRSIVSSDKNPEPPPWWLQILATIQIKYVFVVGVVGCTTWFFIR